MPSAINIGKALKTRGNWVTRTYPVTASQTFVVGDWVYLDTDGTLAICAAASNDASVTYPLGIALEDAADVLDTNVPTAERRCSVMVPEHDGEWFTQIYHSTGASAVIADNAVDAPTTLPLRNQAGNWVLNLENDGTNDRFVITERYQEDSGTETYPRVWCRLRQAARIDGA